MVLVLLPSGGEILSAPSPNGPAPLGKGWGRLLASGILMTVDPAAGAVSLAITGVGRLDAFQGGTEWRQKAITGTRLLHLLPSTLLVDAGGHTIPATAVRVKDPAAAWAVVRPDATILAITLAIAAPRAPAAALTRSSDEHTGREGVVLRLSGSMIEVLMAQGIQRSVVVTPATAVWSGGAEVSVAALSSYDVVGIEGLVNSDGSLVATRINIAFSAASAAQVAGPVEQSVPEISGLVVDGTMIATSAETYILRNETRAPFTQIPAGRPVTVYGTSILSGGVPVGLEARVVVVR